MPDMTRRLNRTKAIALLDQGSKDSRAKPETRAKAKRAAHLLRKAEERRREIEGFRKEAKVSGLTLDDKAIADIFQIAAANGVSMEDAFDRYVEREAIQTFDNGTEDTKDVGYKAPRQGQGDTATGQTEPGQPGQARDEGEGKARRTFIKEGRGTPARE